MRLGIFQQASINDSTRHVCSKNDLREEAIRQRAYNLFIERKKYALPGTPEGDWEQAEWELTLVNDFE